MSHPLPQSPPSFSVNETLHEAQRAARARLERREDEQPRDTPEEEQTDQ